MYRVAGSRSSRALISVAMAGLLSCVNVTPLLFAGTELNAFLLAPQSYHHRRQREHHKCGQSHSVGVAGTLGENRLHVTDGPGQKHATLVGESGKESTYRVGR